MTRPERVRDALTTIAETTPELLHGPASPAPARAFTFTVPVLPDQMLSSNAGKRSRRDPWAVADAKENLKYATMEALDALKPLPTFTRCIVFFKIHHSYKRPKIEQCPRCLIRALSDKRIDSCRCYRPHDVPNIGGEVLKPVVDAMTWMEMFPDDTAQFVEEVRLRIGRVLTVAEERIEVRVVPVEGS